MKISLYCYAGELHALEEVACFDIFRTLNSYFRIVCAKNRRPHTPDRTQHSQSSENQISECTAQSFNLSIYRMIQEESALLWEMIVWVILSKKVHMNMGPILNGYGVMGIF